MDKKQVRRRLWDSLEMHHYRVNFLVITLVFCILFFPCLGRYAEGCVITLLLALPAYGFYGFRIFRILRYPEQYVFTRCKLEKFHFSGFWRAARFSLRLEIPEVGIVNGETALIFTASGLSVTALEDYVNREVTVAYNRATGQVVVIG